MDLIHYLEQVGLLRFVGKVQDVDLNTFVGPSRAEFLLTEEFAKHSNNSAVGLSGQAILFQDIARYHGPYYNCDAKVKSEFCCPVFSRDGKGVGILDAVSFFKDFFDSEKILQISKVCCDLGVFLGSSFLLYRKISRLVDVSAGTVM